MTVSKSSRFLPHFDRPPKVLVTGANGFVGSHLAERLAEIGCQLYLSLRPTSKIDNIQHLNYTPVTLDLADSNSLDDACSDVDYIFHSAGLVKAPTLQRFMDVNVGGTEKLLKFASEHCKNLKRFVYISTQAVMGPSPGKTHKIESATPQPVSQYGQSKLAGEQVVLAMKDTMPITIVRPPAVFGPRDTEVLTFFKFVRSGILLKFGGVESFVSIVYVKDLVDGIIRAAFKEQGIGEIFHINTLDELSQWQAQYMMADAMKVDIRPLRVPLWLLRTVAPMMERIDLKQGNNPTLTADKARELSFPYWLTSSHKARERLDFEPIMPIEESLKETYEWYVAKRWI